MGCCRFTNSWGPVNDYSTKLATAVRPRKHKVMLTVIGPLFKPLLDPLDLSLIAANLICLCWCVFSCPELGAREGLACDGSHRRKASRSGGLLLGLLCFIC